MENRFCLQMVSCGDGCCGGGSSASENVYSTEETVCGRWIDGKPIYRKVISGKLVEESGRAQVFANVPELNIDRVINLYGNLYHVDNLYQIVFPVSFNEPSGVFAAVNMYYDVKANNILYHFLNNVRQYSGATAYAVIEYTKK